MLINNSVNMIGISYSLPEINNFNFPEDAELYIQSSPYYRYNYYGNDYEGCNRYNPNYSTECTVGNGNYYNPKNVLIFSDQIPNYNKIVRFRNYIEESADDFYIFDVYSVEPNVSLPRFRPFENDEVDANFYNVNYSKSQTNHRDLDPIVVSIIEKMYSQKSGDNKRGMYFYNDDDYYKTQLAIWYHLARKYMNTDAVSKQMVTEMNKFINEGNQLAKDVHELVISVEDSVTIENNVDVTDVNEITLTVSDDGKYLESSDIDVVGKANSSSKFNSYSVNLNNDSAMVINSLTGSEQSTGYNNGQKFKIKIPVSSFSDINNMSLKVTISSTFDMKSMVSYYDLSSDDVMQMVPVYNEVYNTSKVVSKSFTILRVNNVDVANGKNIEGTTIRLEKLLDDGTTEKIRDVVTTKDPLYFVLGDGNYILSQVSTNSSYEISDSSITFSIVDSKASLDNISFYQTPIIDVPNTLSGIPSYIYMISGILLVVGISSFVLVSRKSYNKK
ncbi:MAG: Cys-Gln thioester bond-forming surface protein [Bacilli bacterium]|nr:Cys-Gln thioester bond-forming surface protein [Bacilli bacterium]